MRLVEGTDLAQLVASEGALEPDRAVADLAQVAGALDAAHAAGLVHRDVKPANVLVAARRGRARLPDRLRADQARAAHNGMTRTGKCVGTVGLRGAGADPGRARDARADVYALGCLLYHALTGALPFPRDSELAKLYAHLNAPADAASQFARAVRAALDDVIAARWQRTRPSAIAPPATSAGRRTRR